MSDQDHPVDVNNQLVLISAFSGMGKSASLMNIREQEKWLYLNSEAGKRLPFKNKFDEKRIDEPYQIYEAFDYATKNKDMFNGIIIDSATFLMDMYESMYIYNSTNSQKAWGDFAQYFKILMQDKVVKYDKPVVITAHVKSEYNEKSMAMDVSVPVKGSLKNNGIESYFSTVVSAKKVELKELQGMDPALLTITEEDEILGYKHVFQTRITKQTLGERIRSPIGLFSREQLYMNNDAQLLLDHLHRFYEG